MARSASGGAIIGTGTDWAVAHIADLDGDGKGDLVWRHGDGRTAIYAHERAHAGEPSPPPDAGDGWSRTGRVTSTAGKADLVWRNTDGHTAVWLMNGALMTSSSEILGPSSGWSVSGASPYEDLRRAIGAQANAPRGEAGTGIVKARGRAAAQGDTL